jgi:predicted lipoprotein with Yx(FWY)xxD motif
MHTARAGTLGFAAALGSAAALALAAASTATAAFALAPSEAQTSMQSSHHTTVSTRHDSLGTYLVDSKGRTLYLFKKDDRDDSHCSGECAADWPPLIAKGSPRAAGHAQQSMLGTTLRGNGKEQVTYNGHPLYRFEEDQKKGQTRGEGVEEFGAKWFMVDRHGKKVDDNGEDQGDDQGGHGGHGGDW